MILSASEIFELVNHLKYIDGTRLVEYAVVDSVIESSTFENEVYQAIGTDDVPKSHTRKLLYNLIQAKEKDAINLTALIPDIKFSPPPNAGDAGPLYSQVLTECTHAKWRYWNMALMIDDIAMSAARYNNVVISLWRDLENKEIYAYPRHPGTCFVLKKLGKVGEHSAVVFVFKAYGKTITEAYPNATGIEGFEDNYDEYELIEYHDAEDSAVYINQGLVAGYAVAKNRTIAGGKLAGYTHNLEFIPAVVVGNAPSMNTVFAPCYRYHEVPMVELLNDFIVLEHMQKRLNMNYVVKVIDGRKVPKDIPIGGDPAIIEVEPGGDVSVEHLSSPFQTHDMEVSKLEQLYRTQAQFPPGRSGIVQSSITTGKAEAQLQSSTGDDADVTKKRIGWALSELNRKALLMDKRFFPNQKRTLYGKWKVKGRTAIEELVMKPSELPDIIRNELVFNPFGNNLYQQIVSYMQMYAGGGGKGLLDRRTILEKMPGVDVAEVMRRLEEDASWDIKLQTKLQEMMTEAQAQGEAANAQEPTLAPEQIEAMAFASEQAMNSA